MLGGEFLLAAQDSLFVLERQFFGLLGQILRHAEVITDAIIAF